MNLGKSLKIYQARLNISNNELAAKLGVTPTQITRLRRVETWNGKTLIAICDYFGVPCWEFVKEGEQ